MDSSYFDLNNTYSRLINVNLDSFWRFEYVIKSKIKLVNNKFKFYGTN